MLGEVKPYSWSRNRKPPPPPPPIPAPGLRPKRLRIDAFVRPFEEAKLPDLFASPRRRASALKLLVANEGLVRTVELAAPRTWEDALSGGRRRASSKSPSTSPDVLEPRAEPHAVSSEWYERHVAGTRLEIIDGRLVGIDADRRELLRALLADLGLRHVVTLVPSRSWRRALALRRESLPTPEPRDLGSEWLFVARDLAKEALQASLPRTLIAPGNPGFVVSEWSMPEPAVGVVARRLDEVLCVEVTGRQWTSCQATPLVLEIGTAWTLPFLRGRKAEVYAEGGIAEYWIVDVDARRLEVRRRPRRESRVYQDAQVLGPNDSVKPLCGEKKVRVRDLFKDLAPRPPEGSEGG